MNYNYTQSYIPTQSTFNGFNQGSTFGSGLNQMTGLNTMGMSGLGGNSFGGLGGSSLSGFGQSSFGCLPASRTETTVEETSYSNINGYVHQEEHSAHTLNNQLLDKRDLIVDNGFSRGQEFHVDAWGQPHSYNIGNSLL